MATCGAVSSSWRAAPAISRACRLFVRPCRASIPCVTTFDYRNPNALPEGGVLVVGASATGVQLADEIHRSGRPVTLAVGEHVRLPRTYRGRDVLWWMDASGVWNQRYDEIDDLARVRRLPSPQLVGTPERTTLDLNALSATGVELVGRLAAVRDGRALFSGGLRNQFALADLKMNRLLDTFDEYARTDARDAGRPPAGTLRADPRPRLIAARSRPAERRDPFNRLGNGVSSRLQLARRARDRSEGLTCSTTEVSSTLRGCMPSGCRSFGGASRVSSMAPRTTRAMWSNTSPAILPGRQ